MKIVMGVMLIVTMWVSSVLAAEVDIPATTMPTMNCNELTLNAPNDVFRQQCLKERYFGMVIQGLFSAEISYYSSGIGYITYFRSATMSSDELSKLDNVIENAWDFVEKMVQKRNSVYYAPVE